MTINKKWIFGLMILTATLSACSESVINDGKGQAPILNDKPVTPAGMDAELNRPVMMTFKLSPDKSYDENPVEALFPGQGDDAYAIQDLADQTFRFDLEFIFKGVDDAKDSVVGEAELKIELIKKAKKAKKKTTKNTKKKSKNNDDENEDDSFENIELLRNFVSEDIVEVKNIKGIDYLEARMKDVDGEPTHLLVKAQRKHAKNEEEAKQHAWEGNVFLVENSKEIKMGKIQGFFFNNETKEKTKK